MFKFCIGKGEGFIVVKMNRGRAVSPLDM